MVARERLICASSQLEDGGDGVRFDLDLPSGPTPAFVVRYAGTARAFLNRCAHVPIELDWQDGRFFDASGLYLICSVHGAHYEPDTGRCVMGPCKGQSLTVVPVIERDGNIYVTEQENGQREA